MAKKRIIAFLLLLAGILVGLFVYYSEVDKNFSFYKPFKLGLDLKGGSQLIYLADTSSLKPIDVKDAMASLKEVIERRVNYFGVTEPIVTVEQAGIGASIQQRLVVELPGETDLKKAEEMIGKTPTLDFKVERPDGSEKEAIIKAQKDITDFLNQNASTTLSAFDFNNFAISQLGSSTIALTNQDPNFISTELTGKYLSKAAVEWANQSITPSIGITFTDEGGKIFAELTKTNINKKIGIFLDNQLISAPNVREEITDGSAEISGQFTNAEATELVRNLNLGALPVPITLASTQTVGATLGGEAMAKGIKAGLIGFLVIAIFMIVWYRLPGLVSAISLSIYVALMLSIFKLIPVTLTAAGIAGFILTLGIAVDANVLIFERMKEELRRGKNIQGAMHDGFSRAWTSIRDSNLCTIISGCVLFWFGTSLIKGFALNLVLGVLVSMLTAIILTRSLLFAIGSVENKGLSKFLFSNGLKIK